MNKRFILFPIIVGLVSCGNPSSRVHEKQRTPSDIKISALDLDKKTMAIRFNYRTYVEKTLLQLDCEIDFNQDSHLVLNKQFNLALDSFSKEILSFDNIEIMQADRLSQSKAIDYSLQCEAQYDKGKEYIYTDSKLHLVPATEFQYR